jgi:hypothetical protein
MRVTGRVTEVNLFVRRGDVLGRTQINPALPPKGCILVVGSFSVILLLYLESYVS